MKKYISILIIILICLFFFIACDLLFKPEVCFLNAPRTFMASIRNQTNNNFTVQLEIGEIPSKDASFNEFQIINLGYEGEEEINKRIIKKKTNNSVSTRLPLLNENDPANNDELQDLIMNKLISFVITIYKKDTIVYRIVGWNVPEEDFEIYQIDRDNCGYYDTDTNNWIDKYGYEQRFPHFWCEPLDSVEEDFFQTDLIDGMLVLNPNGVLFYINIDSKGKAQLIERGYTTSGFNQDFDSYWKKQ